MKIAVEELSKNTWLKTIIPFNIRWRIRSKKKINKKKFTSSYLLMFLVNNRIWVWAKKIKQEELEGKEIFQYLIKQKR